jgi:lipopolysaccharide transport system permease protein
MLRIVELSLMLGWQDIKQAYRRSAIGQFWITLGMAVQITAMGIVFGAIFGAQDKDYVPFLAVSVVIWTFITTTINDGAKAFISSEELIRQLRLPSIVYVLRVVWRNIIVFGHNALLLPVVLILFSVNVGPDLFWLVPGLLILIANLTWIVALIGLVSARFRDLPLIVSSILTIAFFITPVMWYPELLPPDRAHVLLGLNPFYHLLQIVRLPLLGGAPTFENWILSASLLVVGVATTHWALSRFSKQIPFWV